MDCKQTEHQIDQEYMDYKKTAPIKKYGIKKDHRIIKIFQNMFLRAMKHNVGRVAVKRLLWAPFYCSQLTYATCLFCRVGYSSSWTTIKS